MVLRKYWPKHTCTHARVSAQYLFEKIFKHDTRIINQSLSICNAIECTRWKHPFWQWKAHKSNRNGKWPLSEQPQKTHSPIVWMFFNRLFKPIFDPIVFFCKRRCTIVTMARKLKLFPIILFRKWFKLFMGYYYFVFFLSFIQYIWYQEMNDCVSNE